MRGPHDQVTTNAELNNEQQSQVKPAPLGDTVLVIQSAHI